MAAITAVQKNCENRKIPNPSLIGIAQVFSPQIRRKLEFSSIIPYNDSTGAFVLQRGPGGLSPSPLFFFFSYIGGLLFVLFKKNPISPNNEDKLNRKGFAKLLAHTLVHLDSKDTFTVEVIWKVGMWQNLSCQHDLGRDRKYPS